MSILVLGDLIIDEYLIGTSTRLSPESPVPVITDLHKEIRAGGAANVALNIKSMGSKIKLISQASRQFDTELISELEHVLITSVTTPTKTRIVANNQVICRLDTEQYQRVMLSKNWFSSNPSICVLSDYNKGFLDDSLNIIKLCNNLGILTIVDPKRDWSNYQGCWLLKANLKELSDQLNLTVKVDKLDTICADLNRTFQIENLVITLGSQGLFVWTKTEHSLIPSKDNHVIDVTGAGDVVIAALAHYINQGLDLKSAAKRANQLAGISVTHPGCYTVTQEDMASVEERIVFTNGCFDILHRGHIEYLRKSRSYGTKLIVGLNSDRSVRELKGSSRPVNNEHDRKAMLESLEFVDEVIIFDEPTPKELIQRIKPDIITKGGDYKEPINVVGNDIAQVVLMPYIEGYSTTKIIERI